MLAGAPAGDCAPNAKSGAAGLDAGPAGAGAGAADPNVNAGLDPVAGEVDPKLNAGAFCSAVFAGSPKEMSCSVPPCAKFKRGRFVSSWPFAVGVVLAGGGWLAGEWLLLLLWLWPPKVNPRDRPLPVFSVLITETLLGKSKALVFFVLSRLPVPNDPSGAFRDASVWPKSDPEEAAGSFASCKAPAVSGCLLSACAAESKPGSPLTGVVKVDEPKSKMSLGAGVDAAVSSRGGAGAVFDAPLVLAGWLRGMVKEKVDFGTLDGSSFATAPSSK